jgi:hypothetical protein
MKMRLLLILAVGISFAPLASAVENRDQKLPTNPVSIHCASMQAPLKGQSTTVAKSANPSGGTVAGSALE